MASGIRLGKDGGGSMGAWQGSEDGNQGECKLLSGDFAVLLQVLLGFIAISVLAIKRLREVPRRPLMVWAFDAAKQMVGATFAHVANLLIAIVLYSYQEELESDEESVDQCALYFVNFTLDTTLGIFLNYVLLSAVVLLALRFSWSSLKTPGDYGTPVRPLGAFAFWIQDNFLKKDVRDESFIVAQAAQSPTGSLNGDGKLPSLGTPTDDECSEPGEGDPKLIVAAGNTQEPGTKKLKLDLSSV
ncbi:hypothetical protein PC118_g14743 [Phytophthora cactorum]|uniref:Store-operated calcium entry regulator STIMATE n=1 Tax=Phytophthora cactorum TaxID=29920 RepID=A0A8T1FSU6_9STRA|nr:hypothetical protein PC111_g13614 [Phytophthora cactorum]KAG2924144.1 hypothetical protein PC117_g15453 [Phytophthora cactorum]KAG2974097.1 hypothetical protein PC118_g14743 [Phytophthora cactorum]KAG3004530.1 hypothetical protein PC119_g15614 [Phytophthora cactorum]KAG3011049.1 hypothetical protein PC120_g14684 [Phytophthora cactorum]